MTPPLGVGILGAGPVTQAIHLPTLARLPDKFRVIAVMDIDAQVASSVAARRRGASPVSASGARPPRRGCGGGLQPAAVPRRPGRGDLRGRQARHSLREAAGDQPGRSREYRHRCQRLPGFP